ncbi:MAG: hypothetical protein K9K66_14625 [Desulfarculaceae bacterium]|nr:hypothetical protein [Desulfarculaceae bacterium]MCF8072426.1 hypothetical protein [Desulfarculaceae bacterium]MCF8102887.1 hypothetical protein [Desulfarculaceae bacterium]MCF8118469.1 hypothetical protein [Desulfarculaceae bacterium]
MGCPVHGPGCAGGGIFCNPNRKKDYGNGLWEKGLSDGTVLIGEKGSGAHTHTGSGFVSIKNEETGKHIKWLTNK